MNGETMQVATQAGVVSRKLVGPDVPRPFPNPAFEWAAYYVNCDLAVVPIPYQTKAPIISGWQKLEITARNLDKYFSDKRQNVGVMLGERSQGLVDIDLDSPEAVKLADHFLPKTGAIFGRSAKPSSHRLYLCKDAEFMKFNNPLMQASQNENERKTACIVEIRTGNNGKGIQTVFPPSVHESGEPIEWVRDGEPASVTFPDLETAVKRLAAASLLLKCWRTGIRHDLTLAIAGTLLRHGWSKEDAAYLIRAVCLAANDEELSDRLRAVDDTVKALAKGDKTFGIPKFAELTDQKIVDSFCKWLELQVKLPLAPQIANATVDKPQLFTFTSIKDLLKEPGESSEYVWADVLPVGGLSILAAKPKVGKSTFARNLAVAVAKGEEFFGRECLQGTVIYLVLEEKRSEIAKHFRNLDADDLPILVYSGRTPLQALEALRLAIREHRPSLVIVDPLSRLIHVTDGNSYSENTQALEPLIDIARESTAHIHCLTHNGKMDRGDDGDALIGSTAYFGAVDTLLTLKKNAKNRVLTSTSRYGTDIEPTVVELNSDGLVLSGGEVETVRRNEAKAEIDNLLRSEPMTEPQLRERIEMKAKVVSEALRELVSSGMVRREGKGVKNSPFVYSLASQIDGSPISADSQYDNSSLSSPGIYPEEKNESFETDGAHDDLIIEQLERVAIQTEHLLADD